MTPETPSLTPLTDAAILKEEHCYEQLRECGWPPFDESGWDFARTLETRALSAEARLHEDCVQWAETDTEVKKVCAKHGISETDNPGYFKTAEECAEELSVKLTAVEADNARLRGVLERLVQAGNDQNVALYDSRPIGANEVQAKYVALDKWKKVYQEATAILSKAVNHCHDSPL